MPFGKIGGAVDNTNAPNIPYKSGPSLEDSNLSQDPTGEIRAKTQIIAEQGIDSTPATYVSGDGMDISSSGPSQVNKSRITGIRYQIPYQEIDKTGSGKTFTPEAGAEVRHLTWRFVPYFFPEFSTNIKKLIMELRKLEKR